VLTKKPFPSSYFLFFNKKNQNLFFYGHIKEQIFNFFY
jgi:hypothetical protein